jgi:hypothetical protein
MKMGTIRSPCPYDAAVRDALQSVNLRRPAILRYASWGGCLPDFAGQSSPVQYLSIAAIPSASGIDLRCHTRNGPSPTKLMDRSTLRWKQAARGSRYLTGMTIGWPFSATRKSIARARSVALGFLMR